MMKFIKHYSLEIYTVISMSLIVVAALIGNLSFIQKLIVIDAFLFILHEWEECHYPGGFVDLLSNLFQRKVDAETNRASRLLAGIFLLILTVVPFIFSTSPMIIMILATFGFIEGIVHTVGIRLFRRKHFYTPGMATAWLEFAVSMIMIVYLAVNHLGHWYDYVFGPFIVIAFFVCFQKTMTLMVGINYADMPKYIKAQWNSKNCSQRIK